MSNTRSLFLALVAANTIGCAAASIKTNPEVQFPIPVSAEEPAFLFPINMSHLGAEGDPMAMGLAVSGGVIAQYGNTVISGQQLFDLVGNLSFELAETVDSQVRNGSFEMTGSAEQIATTLASLMEKIVSTLVDLKLLDKPIKFKHIIVLHSHGEAALAPKMLNVHSWGGIYNVETKKIYSYIDDTSTYANEEAAILGQLPLAYNAIIDKLLSGSAEGSKKEEGDAAKKDGEVPADDQAKTTNP